MSFGDMCNSLLCTCECGVMNSWDLEGWIICYDEYRMSVTKILNQWYDLTVEMKWK